MGTAGQPPVSASGKLEDVAGPIVTESVTVAESDCVIWFPEDMAARAEQLELAENAVTP